jgi:parallel beta-helix repeat protein
LYTFILFISLIGIASASTYTVSPTGSSDQKVINAAIDHAAQDGGGTVYLQTGIYDITNTITMKSYIELKGDPDAILRVSASYQWFTDGVVTCDEAIRDVSISGFQCDGNIGNLPREWDSTPGHDRDAGKFFNLGGYSNQMSRNINIHDMKIYNVFSDGIYLKYTDGIRIYNNKIINCQHEGFFLSACQNTDIHDNKISGICSDGGRFMNSRFYKVRNNVFVSFSGDSFGAFKGGEAGLQIGDQINQVDHGFAPSYKPFTTDNAEVTGNIFGYSSERAINLVNIEDTANIIINSNTYLNKGQLERAGIDFDLNYSSENPPTIEQSEKIFSSIFDLFSTKYYSQVGINDTIILPDGVNESPIEATGTIEYIKAGDGYTTLVKVPLDGISEVQYEVNGTQTTHTLMIGEKTKHGIVFYETSIWEGKLKHSLDDLKLDGRVPAETIHVKCITPKSKFAPTFKIIETETNLLSVDQYSIGALAVLIVGLFTIRYILKHSFFSELYTD